MSCVQCFHNFLKSMAAYAREKVWFNQTPWSSWNTADYSRHYHLRCFTALLHNVWPHGGSPSDLIYSIKAGMSQLSDDACWQNCCFDNYLGISANDHEGMRSTGQATIEYVLSITIYLPKKMQYWRARPTKQRLASVWSTFSLGENITMETRNDGAFGHDKADITMVSCVIPAANHGKDIFHSLEPEWHKTL